MKLCIYPQLFCCLFLAFALQSCTKRSICTIEQTGADRWDKSSFEIWVKNYLVNAGFKARIKTSKDDRYLISVPSVDRAQALDLLSLPAINCAFHIGRQATSSDQPIPSGYIKLPFPSDPNGFSFVSRKEMLSIEDIASARAINNNNGWDLSLSFGNELSKKMGPFTKAHRGKCMAIVLDGKIISMPFIAEPFSKGATITGDFGKSQAVLVAAGLLRASGPSFIVVP